MNKICNLLYQSNESQAEVHEIVVDLEVEIVKTDCSFGFGYAACTWKILSLSGRLVWCCTNIFEAQRQGWRYMARQKIFC
jgi:hypothetical protein